MKAKEYAGKYRQNIENGKSPSEAINEVLLGLTKEIKEISELRNVHCDAAFISIVRELDQKFHAFCREVPEYKSQVFLWYLMKFLPGMDFIIVENFKPEEYIL